jgi:hypothetical protein
MIKQWQLCRAVDAQVWSILPARQLRRRRQGDTIPVTASPQNNLLG